MPTIVLAPRVVYAALCLDVRNVRMYSPYLTSNMTYNKYFVRKSVNVLYCSTGVLEHDAGPPVLYQEEYNWNMEYFFTCPTIRST
jgi:hypothetical protein